MFIWKTVYRKHVPTTFANIIFIGIINSDKHLIQIDLKIENNKFEDKIYSSLQYCNNSLSS